LKDVLAETPELFETLVPSTTKNKPARMLDE